jgi:hypothetical protein
MKMRTCYSIMNQKIKSLWCLHPNNNTLQPIKRLLRVRLKLRRKVLVPTILVMVSKDKQILPLKVWETTRINLVVLKVIKAQCLLLKCHQPWQKQWVVVMQRTYLRSPCRLVIIKDSPNNNNTSQSKKTFLKWWSMSTLDKKSLVRINFKTPALTKYRQLRKKEWEQKKIFTTLI